MTTPDGPVVRVLDLRGSGGPAPAPVLADPSGRRAVLLHRAGRVVGALFLLWFACLVLAGLGLLPASGVPLGGAVAPAAEPTRLGRIPDPTPAGVSDLRPAEPLAASLATGSGASTARGGTKPTSAAGRQPGRSGAAPGQSTTSAPGKSGAAPGQSTTSAPGKSGTAPGQSTTTAPGNSGTAPGHATTTTPGSSGSAPGQTTTAPGKSPTAPGHTTTTPGNSGTAPGQTTTTPGNSGTAPGQGRTGTTGHGPQR